MVSFETYGRTYCASNIVSTHEVNLGHREVRKGSSVQVRKRLLKKVQCISTMTWIIIGGVLPLWWQRSVVSSVHYFTVISTQKMEYIPYWSKPCNAYNFVEFSEFRDCYILLRNSTILQSPPEYRAIFSRSTRWKKAYLPTNSKFSMPSFITPAHLRQ